MLQSVLFDIDNTLLLKKPSIPELVFQQAAPSTPGLTQQAVEKAYGASELWQGRQIQKENETGVKMPDQEYLQNVFWVYQQALGLADELAKPLFQVFMGDYEISYQPAPGLREVLEDLKAQGISLGIVSNNHSGVRRALEEWDLPQYFDSIVISQEVGLFKPDPKILELACSQLGTPCEASLYVGDHPFDVLCAHMAHMPALWLPVNQFMAIPEGVEPPEFTARSFPDAGKILREQIFRGEEEGL